ncbi:MAG TPA: 1-deoxy-D-xylulose-5-phosphate reductoisomerase [Chlamydiales bacterium]|nr:1-deoxy-D-xylulose-5-phosphate reductoisomerase [Chlamydiales bacterium]
MKKKVVVLGSSGSVGLNTIDVIKKSDNFEIIGLAVHSNIEKLQEQVQEFSPKHVCVFDENAYRNFKKESFECDLHYGIEGLNLLASLEDADIIVVAISGSVALMPTLKAIEHNKKVAIANKEVFVAAGDLVNSALKKHQAELIPVDSEHSAIFQCLQNNHNKDVQRIILTASGGPFVKYSMEQLEKVTLKDALKHPTYSMGKKISIDSSTLMNKGLEVIEAHYLFNVDSSKIDVVVHPQSFFHSFVEYVDGSILSQSSNPDMRLPIQYALNYPVRKSAVIDYFDFGIQHSFDFFPPDKQRFPCLQLAYDALEEGKSMPCFLNAANEVIVKRFLNEEFSWMEIPKKLEKLMSSHQLQDVLDLSQVLAVEQEAFERATNI